MSLSPLHHLEKVSCYCAARTYFFIEVFFGLLFCSSHSFLVQTRWKVLLMNFSLHAQFSRNTPLFASIIRPLPVMVDLVVAASGAAEFTLALLQVPQRVTCKQEWIRIGSYVNEDEAGYNIDPGFCCFTQSDFCLTFRKIPIGRLNPAHAILGLWNQSNSSPEQSKHRATIPHE